MNIYNGNAMQCTHIKTKTQCNVYMCLISYLKSLPLLANYTTNITNMDTNYIYRHAWVGY